MFAVISEERTKKQNQLIGYAVVDTEDGCVELIEPEFLSKLKKTVTIMGNTDNDVTPVTLFDVVKAQLLEMTVLHGMTFKVSPHSEYNTDIKLRDLLSFVKSNYPLLYNAAQKQKHSYFPCLALEQSVPKLSSFKMPWGVFCTIRNFTGSLCECLVDKFVYSNTCMINGISLSDLHMRAGCIEFSENIKYIPMARFRNTSDLHTVIFKEGLESIGEEAFMGTNLQEVVLPSSLAKLDGEAFSYCGELRSVEFKGNSLRVLPHNAFFSSSKLERVVLPRSLSMIEGGAFSKTAIKTIDLPEGLSYIGVSAFSECCNLERIDLPKTVKTIIRGAFYSCKNLKSVTFSPLLTSIDESTFLSCSALEEIDMSNTAITVIANGAFGKCSSLKRVVFSDKLESIGTNAFLETSIEHLVFPDTLRRIDFCAFKSNHLLSSIDYVKDNISIDDDAFFDCPLLQSDLLKTKAVSTVSISMNLKGFISLLEQCSESQDVLQPVFAALQTNRIVVYCSNALSVNKIENLTSTKVTTDGLSLLFDKLVNSDLRIDLAGVSQLYALFPNVAFDNFTVTSEGGAVVVRK